MSLWRHRRREPEIMREQRRRVIDDMVTSNSDMIATLQAELRKVVGDE